MKGIVPTIAAWYVSLNFTREISIAYVGVPLNVLFACAVGAICSFSVGDKVEPRRRMWGLGFACVLMGAAFTSICGAAITHFMELQMTDALQVGVACVTSFMTRFLLPRLADWIKNDTWVRFIPFIKKD